MQAGVVRLKVVVLKDVKNKKAHEQSAQMACEAAGAIRTVASLTREDDCSKIYATYLDEPQRQSNHTAIVANAWYSLSQALTFFVIALIFWYVASPFRPAVELNPATGTVRAFSSTASLRPRRSSSP